MKKICTIVLLLSLAIATRAQEKPSAAFQEIFKLIVVKKGFMATNDPAVLSFAKSLGVTAIAEDVQNPICCIRIEPLAVDRAMTGEQYVMVHYGYTLVQVTGTKALEMLGKRLDALSHPTNALPAGLLTSFRDPIRQIEKPRPR